MKIENENSTLLYRFAQPSVAAILFLEVLCNVILLCPELRVPFLTLLSILLYFELPVRNL